MSELPNGVVTFLFTDIEGSTRLVKALRGRYPQILAEHRRLVRAAIASHAGHELDTQGDAFFVAFAGAKQAVLCALEIQRALAGHAWPAGVTVRVRIGIHTGNAVPDGGGYTGLAVHRAARICAAAHGGQVFVSQATQTIIEDEEEAPGFTLLDVGERRLKDLDRPVRLFQIAAPGLDSPGSPVPSGLPAEPTALLAGVLPVPATPLVGREQEAAAVADLVLGEGVRLVTLTGPGGVGKSRLVVEVARRLGPKFTDGVRFVELAAVPVADLVPAAVAAGLGLTTSAGRLITDVVSYLRGRRLLLVLDNFEHVVSAAGLLAELLAAAPGVVVLVTSRVVLRLRGEHEFAVPPLAVPAAGAGPDTDDVRGYASVGLFVERAHAAAPGFEMTSENAAAIAEICRRLDGLPLAIELAAARVRLLPPQALISRLGQRFSLLTGGARDLPERQRTLRNTLDWSYGLLSAGEQTMLARLGVFAGTFGLPAAEAVCGAADAGGHAGQVMDTLGSLVDNSLVRAETRGSEPRFALLETIREYALERLRDGDDWAQAHDRHAAYFLALAEPKTTELHGRGQLAWLDRLEAEHGNVRATLSWLTHHGPLQHAVRLFSVSWRFWWLHGHAAEFAQLGEEIVANSEHLPPYQRALALTTTGFMLIANEDQARAQALFEQSLPLYHRAGGKLCLVLTAAVQGILGQLAARCGDYSRASELLGQSQALLADLDDHGFTGYARYEYLLFVCMVNNILGHVRFSQGDLDGAAGLFSAALAAGREGQDRLGFLVSLYNVAACGREQGDLAGAAGHLREGLALAAEAGDETSAAYYLEGMAAVASLQDNPERAVRLFTAASSMLESSGSGWLHAYIPRVPRDDTVLATLRSRTGDAAFGKAEAWGRSTGHRRAVEYALE
jgi:predicted ATPase/class 3 adenylate cyclase/tetratricopeptide (TPR) repeat protein